MEISHAITNRRISFCLSGCLNCQSCREMWTLNIHFMQITIFCEFIMLSSRMYTQLRSKMVLIVFVEMPTLRNLWQNQVLRMRVPCVVNSLRPYDELVGLPREFSYWSTVELFEELCEGTWVGYILLERLTVDLLSQFILSVLNTGPCNTLLSLFCHRALTPANEGQRCQHQHVFYGTSRVRPGVSIGKVRKLTLSAHLL